MRISVLGPLTVHDDAGELIELKAPKQRLLLALLVARRGSPIDADSLLDALWNGAPPDSAGKALSWHLSKLRKAIGAQRIVREPNGYVLRVPAEAVDAQRFEELSAAGIDHLPHDPGAAAERLGQALDLWRGHAYDGLADTGPLRQAADRLDEQRLIATRHHNDAELDLGRHHELIPELTALVADHPFREELRAQLMLAHYRAGRQTDALRVFRDGRELLARTLEQRPGAQLRELHRRILAADPDLGATRGKRSAPRPLVTTQLPSMPRFVGRDTELAELRAFAEASRDTVVVAAVDGMPGVGKTTLTLQIAHELTDRYPDGHLFIDLHGYSGDVPPLDTVEALARLLRALGMSDSEIPTDVDARGAAYRSRVAGGRLIIVLDNAYSEEQVRPLLPGRGQHLVLVTSRRRLSGIDDARHLTLGLLNRRDATALFLHTVGQHEPGDDGLDDVAEVVERCNRLPLAIRVAAAHLNGDHHTTIDDLLNRLSDARHRLGQLRTDRIDVAAAFDVSMRHLGPEHRRVFHHLGRFPGPHVDRFVAAALAGTDVSHAERVLDDLTDSHLLEPLDADHYGFHDLIREFAAGTAVVGAERALSRREAARRLGSMYLVAALRGSTVLYPAATRELTVDVEPAIPSFGPAGEERAWANWFAAETENISAVITECLDTGLVELAAKLTVAIAPYLETHTYHLRLRAHGAAVLDAFDTIDEPELKALVHKQFAGAAGELGAYDEALTHMGAALTLFRSLGDDVGVAAALNNLAWIYTCLGRGHESIRLYDEAIALAAKGSIPEPMLAVLRGNRAGEYRTIGRLDEAISEHRLMWKYHSETGSPRSAAMSVHNLVLCLQDKGQYRAALDLHQQTIEYFEQHTEPRQLCVALSVTAKLHSRLGQRDRAMSILERALGIAERASDLSGQCQAVEAIGTVHLHHGEPKEAIEHFEAARRLANRLELRAQLLPIETGIADSLEALGRPDQARPHLQRAWRLSHEMGMPQAEALRLRCESPGQSTASSP